MPYPAADDRELVTDTSDGEPQLVAQLGERVTADIPQLHVLEVLPKVFIRVQLRRVGRQRLQVQATGRPARQEVLHDLGAVDGRAVPDHQQPPGHMTEQVLEEPDYIGAAQRAVAHLQEELAGGRNGADGREMVARQRDPQHGRLAPRGIGADSGRQQIEARFVYPDERPLLGLGFFSRAGICSAVQAAMAASLRWVARRSGFCTVQGSERSSRLRWAGW